MTDDMASTVALVTGANKGIGLEIAARLAGLGITVLLSARDARRRAEAVAELRSRGHEDVHPVALDVTEAESVLAAAEDVDARFGRLDVLVNNAGISGNVTRQTPGSTDLAVVRQVFEVNVFGVAAVTDAMLPLLRRSAAGRVVNVTSSLGSLGLMSTPGSYHANLRSSSAYAPSKSALNALTVQYAKELRASGILVNAADPGGCATDFTKSLGRPIARTAAQGAAIAVRLATLGADGPTGGYFNGDGPVPW
jgi:NAD(P)-dependent dehydrogenase (short-subunit alcohol dehydrogenase family)